ncbi:MAG: DNA mismatch repair endonuclease MutL [Clostridia bacterium]|nr:DNA mismatch repair endonuclease MutL [Clostridia bacterium]
MPKINLMPKEMSELIAAGEVVERPASVVKELVENSIDAGAKHITLEIERGGILYIRVTDDGCGIEAGDVPTAFLRHATSKVKTIADLDRISSLGFRGEALAATAIVSKVELFTKQKSDTFGTHYIIEGGNEVLNEENGCPDGTTIIVRDIFYNTPARMKFLKRDITEGNSVAAVFERMALSNPQIAFKMIRDGKLAMSTSGDGKPYSAIYSVLGREIASTMIPVNSNGDISVSGYVCKPAFCRKSRSAQYIFLNGRYVQSNTVMAACEQAYKNSAMVGKYPAFVINITVPFETVDVNVHPAKIQVRFSDEKKIFDEVYIAVKNAISNGDTRPEIKISNKTPQSFTKMPTDTYTQQTIVEKAYSKAIIKKKDNFKNSFTFKNDNTPFFEREDVKKVINNSYIDIEVDEPAKPVQPPVTEKKPIERPEIHQETNIVAEEEIIFIGEAFSTYIIAQKGDSIYLVDKHAAHERLNFNKLKENAKNESQQLLMPQNVRLSREEFDAVVSNLELMEKAGFELEDFGNSTILVRAVPAMLHGEDITDMLVEAAQGLITKGIPESERLDRIYHTVACKAAIKGGNITTRTELEALAKKILADNDVMYCPHGRPVAFQLTKKELEKQFGRIQ